MSDTIYAEVLCDSINPAGDRLTTFVVEGPRFILAEINTHRWASRNASSSRAIPFKRMIQDLDRNTVYPVRWGRNRPGMQAGGELDLDASQACREEWDLARADAIRHAERLAALGLHKQWVNRLVEPFMVWRGIMSATNWVNFFKLRAHPDAQPEFQILAYRMLHKYLESEPEEMDWGDWHIPYDEHTPEEVRLAQRLRISVARCARVSYLSFEGEVDPEKDLKLYEKLAGAEPPHASPLEHVAVARRPNLGEGQGNFHGWLQFRKMIANEACREMSREELQEILDNRPDYIEV